MNKENMHLGITLAFFIILTLCVALLGIMMGSAPLTVQEVWEGVSRKDPKATYTLILWSVRLPRVSAALLAGAGLAVSGVLLQAATDNPLAGPNIIGVNAGAGFAMILSMCVFPFSYRTRPMAAFLGAFACAALIVLISQKAGGGRVMVVLAGAAVSTLLNAGISFLRLLYPDLAVNYNHFSAGGVEGVTFSLLTAPAVMILACFLTAELLASRMNLLCLGDSIAAGLGVRVRPLRAMTLLLASASAAAVVSFAGLLGFVGLMVPHIARRFVGSDIRILLPASVLLGAILVTVSDLVGRVFFAPSEIPAGIITAFIGVPFFFALLMQRRNRL